MNVGRSIDQVQEFIPVFLLVCIIVLVLKEGYTRIQELLLVLVHFASIKALGSRHHEGSVCHEICTLLVGTQVEFEVDLGSVRGTCLALPLLD